MDRLIGLAGRRAAGRDTAGTYLESRGFVTFSVSDEIRREALLQGQDIAQRGTLRAVGREIRETQGGDVFIRRAIERWETQRNKFLGGLAIISHFNLVEAEAVLERDGTIAFIVADDECRLSREEQRGRPDAPQTVEELLSAEEVEFKGFGGPNEPHLEAVASLPETIVIDNNGDLPHFYRQLDELL